MTVETIQHYRMGVMNAFFVIILAAVVVEYLLGVVSNLMNLSALRPEAPEGLEDVYEPDKYAKSQEYTKVNTGFDLITSTFKLALLLTFWLFGGFNWLDELVRGWEFHVILNGVLYIGLLGLAYMVITLPFSIYRTFVIEGAVRVQQDDVEHVCAGQGEGAGAGDCAGRSSARSDLGVLRVRG